MIIVKKVLNSSVVLVDKNSQEFIALGRGIGYGKKIGDLIPEIDVDKIYLPVGEGISNRFLDLLNEVAFEYFEMASIIIKLAEKKLGIELNKTIYLTLADHLSFAVERQKKGMNLVNRLQWELENYYPKEFEVANESLIILSEKYNFSFYQEEASNIAFHLINAQDKSISDNDAFKKSKLISSILNIVKYSSLKDFDVTSIHYRRFLTHVRYFVDRLFSNQLIVESNDGLYDQMLNIYPESVEVSLKIKNHIEESCGFKMPKSEISYLAVHINRLINFF